MAEEKVMNEETVVVEETTVEKTTVEETNAEKDTTEKADNVKTAESTETTSAKSSAETSKEPEVKFEYDEDDIPRRRLFSSQKEDMNFLRDKWILSRIKDEDLMEYLRLEQKRNDQLQEAKERRDKRLMFAFTLTVSLIAAVVAIYFLKDNPVLLTNILYICGILFAFWMFKNPRDKK